MARYNSVNSIGSIAGGSTISTPASGLLTTITSAGTTFVPNPTLYTGSTQAIYNASGSTITLSTNNTGNFVGAGGTGSSTISLVNSAVITMVSDGTNYIIQDFIGGAISATTLSASGAVTLNPANSTVSLQPTGSGTVTIAPGAVGTIDNMSIGATTKSTGAFTSLSATGIISTSAITAATLGTGGTGALQVSGGASIAGGLNVGGVTYHASNIGVGTSTPNISSFNIATTVNAPTSGNAAYELAYNGAVTGMVRTDSGTFEIRTGTTDLILNSNPAGNSNIIFKTGSNNERLRINSSGYLGIGTNNPLVSLDLGSRSDAIFLPVGNDSTRPAAPSAGMQRYNSARADIEFYDGTAWRQVTIGIYSIDYLIVAGGGSGGGGQVSLGGAGGGGAGGLIYGSMTVSGGNSFSFTVGGGGSAPAVNSLAHGNSGGNTTAFGQTAIGGGGGGYGASASAGYGGGSGGGGGYNGYSSASNGGAGTAGQGNAGGGVSGVSASGGGGGGYSSGGSSNTGSGGGSGGVGGSGYVWLDGNTYAVGGQGGAAAVNQNATNGTGNGSPGAYAAAQTWSGGGGVVIVRYIGGTRGTGGTITSASGYTYHTFTSSGTFTA